MSIDKQPVSSVVWVDREQLKPNDYNPNHVSPIEMDLLEMSLLEAGWVFPIVARKDGTIIDGEHRWKVTERPAVYALTSGLVPVVYVEADISSQVMHTIRLNRARGQHTVMDMSEIVRTLLDDHGLDESEVMERLGMELEEIERLYDQASMPDRAGKGKGFAMGWIPKGE